MDLKKEFERYVSKSQFDHQKLDLTEDLYFGGYKSTTTQLCFHYFLYGVQCRYSTRIHAGGEVMMEKYDYDLSPTPLQLECERLRKEAEIGKQMLGRMMSEYAELRDQLAEAKKDAALWKARLHTYLMYRPPADSTARDAILDCELKVLSDENKPTFDEWVAAIDQTVEQAMRERE